MIAAHLSALLLGITFPLMTVQDDSGAIVAGATVTIASVTDKAGTAIASHGATVNLAGANVSVDYDPATKGEAWVTLSVSKVGSTFTGVNAAPAFYLAGDSGRILSALPSSGTVPTLPAIVAGTWDELKAGHTVAGSFGRYLDAAISGIAGGGGSSGTVAVIAATVTASGSATTFTASLGSNAPASATSYAGRRVYFQSGTANQERGTILSAVITGSSGSYTATFTLNPSVAPAVKTSPGVGDTLVIY